MTRRIDLRAERRGVYRFGQVALEAGDLLGEPVADEDRELPTVLVVRPRTLPVRRFEATRDRSGPLRARHGLIEDPSRFAGVRPYAPGDPVRHLHWRTTARLGEPVVKRFDPSRDRDVVIALDIQTNEAGWAGQHDDDLAETLCVVAASLARQLESEDAACGLAVAAFTGTPDRLASLAPSSAEHQSGRIGDLLARISPYPSAPFEHLLGRLVRIARPGTLVVIVSARSPGAMVAGGPAARASGVRRRPPGRRPDRRRGRSPVAIDRPGGANRPDRRRLADREPARCRELRGLPARDRAGRRRLGRRALRPRGRGRAGPPALPSLAFVVVASATCLGARRLDRAAESRVTIIVGLLVGGAVAGLLASATVALLVRGSSPLGALVDDPGAVVVGLAALRGFIRAGALRDPAEAQRPFFVGLSGWPVRGSSAGR